MQKENFRVWTFQTRFRPEDSQLLAQSLISCLAVIVCGQQKKRVATEKSSDLKLQTLATYSSYVRQVRVRVRVKVRVNTKKWKISTSRGTRMSTSLLQDFLNLCTFC
jgi:hypothetical protein